MAEHLRSERRKRIASWRENPRCEWKLRKGVFQVKGNGNRGRCSPEVSAGQELIVFGFGNIFEGHLENTRASW